MLCFYWIILLTALLFFIRLFNLSFIDYCLFVFAWSVSLSLFLSLFATGCCSMARASSFCCRAHAINVWMFLWYVWCMFGVQFILAIAATSVTRMRWLSALFLNAFRPWARLTNWTGWDACLVCARARAHFISSHPSIQSMVQWSENFYWNELSTLISYNHTQCCCCCWCAYVCNWHRMLLTSSSKASRWALMCICMCVGRHEVPIHVYFYTDSCHISVHSTQPKTHNKWHFM